MSEKVIEQSGLMWLRRAVARVPKGSQVYIRPGTRVYTHESQTHVGGWVLTNSPDGGQCIAYSVDQDDLLLFALQHDYWIDSPEFKALQQ